MYRTFVMEFKAVLEKLFCSTVGMLKGVTSTSSCGCIGCSKILSCRMF